MLKKENSENKIGSGEELRLFYNDGENYLRFYKIGDYANDKAPHISGTWTVTEIGISGELQKTPGSVFYSETLGYQSNNTEISITISNGMQGNIAGHTFQNSIGFEFEIKENRQIILLNYGGTRAAEDEWGTAFRDHIMFNVVKFDNSKNNELVFFDSNDNPVIIFNRKE